MGVRLPERGGEGEDENVAEKVGAKSSFVLFPFCFALELSPGI